MTRVTFLSRLSAEEVRELIRGFADSYKRDWQRWVEVAQFTSLDAATVAQGFREVLKRWQAVRSRTKGRVVRHCRTPANSGELCIEDLLREATPFVQELGTFTLRDARAPTPLQERALRFLWDIFRMLPSTGTANAVGITKAVKLVTLGRVGPALDTSVREKLGIGEPRSADEWVMVLRAISDDLSVFERRTGAQLETLVGDQWKPIAVGRAYDMVAGPRRPLS